MLGLGNYNVGDRVRIVPTKGTRDWNDLMDKYLGTVMTVKKIEGASGTYYRMVEDQYDRRSGGWVCGWVWGEDMIVGLAGYPVGAHVLVVDFVPQKKYRGCVVTIDSYDPSEDTYTIVEDGGKSEWTSGMFAETTYVTASEKELNKLLAYKQK